MSDLSQDCTRVVEQSRNSLHHSPRQHYGLNIYIQRTDCVLLKNNMSAVRSAYGKPFFWNLSEICIFQSEKLIDDCIASKLEYLEKYDGKVAWSSI